MEKEKVTFVEKFSATCNVCGEKIAVNIAGDGYFAQIEDKYEWRVPLDRTEVESHLLMHSICTCRYEKAAGRVETILSCPIHGRLP